MTVAAFRDHDPFYQDLYRKHDVLAAIGGTRLVRLAALETEFPRGRVWAKLELTNPGGSLKDRPVLAMLVEALRAGELAPGRTVLDSSSGNAGIAYALIGSVLGVPVELVLPGNASRERQERIKAHGAQVRLTDPVLGYDEALREAHRLSEAEPDLYFMPDQYANAENWRSHHEGTGAEIVAQLEEEPTHFVGGVGTGGSLTGIGRRLKERWPKLQVVCVVPDAFPGIEGLKPMETPEDVVPEIFDASVVDRRVRVPIEEAWSACQLLARHGLFCGQSTGAYLHAVREVFRAEPTARVVTLACDLGERYFSTRLWS